MKRILIVGASSGIGRALAENLSAQNYSVISLSRRKPECPVDLHISHDLRSDKALPELDGVLDGLVYCPGSVLLKPFRLLKDTDFLQDFELNVLGAVRVIRHYLPALQQSGKASILLFSSVAARLGMPYHSSVAVSKAAVEGLALSLAAELGPSIRVNAIAPSLVQTGLTARLTDTAVKIMIAGEKHPMKRIGQPADIASLAALLLSDDSSWITGQVFPIDGGISTLKI